MGLPRFRIRTLILAVAIGAVIFAAIGALARRREVELRRAAWHAREERRLFESVHSSNAKYALWLSGEYSKNEPTNGQVDAYQPGLDFLTPSERERLDQAGRHRQMKRDYRDRW